MPGKIVTGTASWMDPGFVAHWYPADLPAKDRLRWYAEHFNLVEVNSTFYRVPEARAVTAWCEQTPPGFIFDVKLHRFLSRHSTGPELLPPEIRSKAVLKGKRVQITPGLEKEVARRFLKGIEPLKTAGKLGALLLQLSPGFGPRHNGLEELEHIIELFHGYRLAFELRNRGWVTPEHLAETKAFFKRHRVAFVMVDAPEDPHFTIMANIDLVTTPRLAYLRAHGRNAPAYIRERTVAGRFDYDYPKEELKEIADRAFQAAEKAREVHVVYNNNKADYAPRAAAAFQKIVHEQHPDAIPSEVEDKPYAFA